jgi:urate oxidase
MAKVLFDTYGKTKVRLTYVNKNSERHEIRELTVNIFFEGEFNVAYTHGDNSSLLPTDTMKNTVYLLAKQLQWNDIETFAHGLADHFLARVPQLSQIRIEISETPWEHIGNHTTAFIQSGAERRITELIVSRSNWLITSGLSNLQILKTAHSAFTGFRKDEFTTLAETNDRLFGTVLDAKWTYTRADIDFNALHKDIRGVLLNTFAEHHSLSVQHTLFAMAEAAVNAFDVLGEIHLTMPNRHCLLVDLAKFGLENPNQIFVPIDEPSGYIEARVTRG